MSVAIVDYGSGNLHSAAKAFERAAEDLNLGQAWVHELPSQRVAPTAAAHAPGVAPPRVPQGSDVVGLFPEPGAQR